MTHVAPPLLAVRDLAVSFTLGGGRTVRAVNGLSLTVHAGQTVALVGESGCGKSVTALSILGLLPRVTGRVEGGSMVLDGLDLRPRTEAEMLAVRGREVAMIFQEPMTSLNPVQRVGVQIIEAIRLHQHVDRRTVRRLAADALAEVGIVDASRRLDDYPHQFSGGMRQRVMIAMALACRPKLLVADEPTTALDVTIQAQILTLLRRLQRAHHMGVLLITHDLLVVGDVADVVCVVFNGRVMEYAPVEKLFRRCHHPYTRGLIGCIPRLGRRPSRLATVEQFVTDANQYRNIPGASFGVEPWWPDRPAPADLPPAAADDGYRLHEVEPNHWVGCWATPFVRDHPNRAPDIGMGGGIKGSRDQGIKGSRD